MPNRSALLPAAVLLLLTVASCERDSAHFSEPTPPVAGPVIGMIQGSVDAGKMTATFTPLAPTFSMGGGVSPAIYGNQGVTAKVYGVVDSMIDVVGVRRTWYVRVALENLEAFPIGSNYTATNATPLDTSGVFLFFSSLPVVTIPSGASAVNVINAMGTANFQAPNQKYFWYRNRPTAVTGTPGTDTTQNNPEWQFQTTAFTGADTAHAFTFVLLVNAAWPRTAADPSLTVTYDGTNDSLPDTAAEPRWQPNALLGTFGTDSWSASGLVLNAGFNVSDSAIYFTRSDSLGAMSARMRARLKLATVLADTIQAVIGFVEPGGGKQMFIGIANNRVSFASFTNSGLMAGSWTVLGPTTTIDATAFHTYALRKIGRSQVGLCFDGVQVTTLTYASMQDTQSNLDGLTTVFGMRGNATGAQSTWTSITYSIGTGNFTSGC